MDNRQKKAYTVELEITRAVTVVIEASSDQEARQKANDLDYRHEIVGEISRWAILSVTATKA